MTVRILFLLGAVLLSTVLNAATLYVDDTLYLGFYKSSEGAGKQFTSAPSGTKLTLIEVKDNYSLVRTEKGTEGWVKNKYLVETPPAVVRIKSLEREAVRAVALAVEVDKLSEENAFLRDEIDAVLLQLQTEQVEQDLASIPTVPAADVEPAAEAAMAIPVDQRQLAALKTAIEDAMQALQKVSDTAPSTKSPEPTLMDLLFSDLDEETSPLMAWDFILAIPEKLNSLHYALLAVAIVSGFFLGIFVLDRRIRRQHGGYRIW